MALSYIQCVIYCYLLCILKSSCFLRKTIKFLYSIVLDLMDDIKLNKSIEQASMKLHKSVNNIECFNQCKSLFFGHHPGRRLRSSYTIVNGRVRRRIRAYTSHIRFVYDRLSS